MNWNMHANENGLVCNPFVWNVVTIVHIAIYHISGWNNNNNKEIKKNMLFSPETYYVLWKDSTIAIDVVGFFHLVFEVYEFLFIYLFVNGFCFSHFHRFAVWNVVLHYFFVLCKKNNEQNIVPIFHSICMVH